jgi:hypothetical protein
MMLRITLQRFGSIPGREVFFCDLIDYADSRRSSTRLDCQKIQLSPCDLPKTPT